MKILNLFFVFILLEVQAEPYVQELNESLEVIGINGITETLEEGTSILIKDILNRQNQEVFILDEDENIIADKSYEGQKNEVYLAISTKFNFPLDIVDDLKVRSLSSNSLIVVFSELKINNNSYLEIGIINENGDRIDENGELSNKTYKILKKSYEEAIRKNFFEEIMADVYKDRMKKQCYSPLMFANENSNLKINMGYFWFPDVDKLMVLLDEKDRNKIEKISHDPYKIMMLYREKIKGKKNCLNLKKNFENELLKMTSWKDTSDIERAKIIYDKSKSVFTEIKSVSTKSEKSNQKTYRNGHYLHSILSPELASCISFRETKGSLNPLSFNYSFCAKSRNPRSTAIGLGQMTRSTMSDMIEGGRHNDLDLYPLGSSYSNLISDPLIEIETRREKLGIKLSKSEYKKMRKDNRDLYYNAHSPLFLSPELQIETIYRTLNEKAKLASIKKEENGIKDILELTIYLYDQDKHKAYIPDVKSCVSCLKSGKDVKNCYKEMKERK